MPCALLPLQWCIFTSLCGERKKIVAESRGYAHNFPSNNIQWNIQFAYKYFCWSNKTHNVFSYIMLAHWLQMTVGHGAERLVFVTTKKNGNKVNMSFMRSRIPFNILWRITHYVHIIPQHSVNMAVCLCSFRQGTRWHATAIAHTHTYRTRTPHEWRPRTFP